MRDISDRLLVRCSYAQAAHYITSFVAEHQNGDEYARVTLSLPIRLFAERRTLVERSLIATLCPLTSANDSHPTYSLTWSPSAGVTLPSFAGALAVERVAREQSFGLMVSGHYESQSCEADSNSNAALERRVAHGSARELLRFIAAHVERACAHDEAARASYSSLKSFYAGAGHALRSSEPFATTK